MSSDTGEDFEMRERPRPSRRKRRKKRVLGIVPRLALVTLVIALTGIICVALGTKIVQPYQMSHEQSQQMAALKDQLSDTTSQNSALERQATYLRRPDGIETEARSQGYLKPGEISLVIENPPVSAAPAPSGGFTDRLRRAWNHLVGR